MLSVNTARHTSCLYVLCASGVSGFVSGVFVVVWLCGVSSASFLARSGFAIAIRSDGLVVIGLIWVVICL